MIKLTQDKINKIKEMKNPVILINSNDYNNFKSELKTSNNPNYNNNILIIKSDIVEKGNIIVYDSKL